MTPATQKMTPEPVPGPEAKPTQVSKKEELKRSLLAEAKNCMDGWTRTRLTYFLHLWRNSEYQEDQEDDSSSSESQHSSSEQSGSEESETPDDWEELADDEKQEQRRRRRRRHRPRQSQTPDSDWEPDFQAPTNEGAKEVKDTWRCDWEPVPGKPNSFRIRQKPLDVVMIKNGVWEVVRDENGPVAQQDWYYEDAPPVYRNTKTEMYHYIGTRRRLPNLKSLARVVPDHAAITAEQKRERQERELDLDANGVAKHRIRDRVIAAVAKTSYSMTDETGRVVWYARDGRRLNCKGHPIYTKEEKRMPISRRPDLTKDKDGNSYLDD